MVWTFALVASYLLTAKRLTKHRPVHSIWTRKLTMILTDTVVQELLLGGNVDKRRVQVSDPGHGSIRIDRLIIHDYIINLSDRVQSS